MRYKKTHEFGAHTWSLLRYRVPSLAPTDVACAHVLHCLHSCTKHKYATRIYSYASICDIQFRTFTIKVFTNNRDNVWNSPVDILNKATIIFSKSDEIDCIIYKYIEIIITYNREGWHKYSGDYGLKIN